MKRQVSDLPFFFHFLHKKSGCESASTFINLVSFWQICSGKQGKVPKNFGILYDFSLTYQNRRDKLLCLWGRGVVVKHAALSRPRPRVQIPSLPPKKETTFRQFLFYLSYSVIPNSLARSSKSLRFFSRSFGYVR